LHETQICKLFADNSQKFEVYQDRMKQRTTQSSGDLDNIKMALAYQENMRKVLKISCLEDKENIRSISQEHMKRKQTQS